MCNRVKLETGRHCNQYFINQELEYASCIEPCRVLMHDIPSFNCYYCGCERRLEESGLFLFFAKLTNGILFTID